jgi:hypothetical protein
MTNIIEALVTGQSGAASKPAKQIQNFRMNGLDVLPVKVRRVSRGEGRDQN